MNTLYIDIETVPAQRPDVLADIRDGKAAELEAAIAAIAPPGNYKKAETIAEWMANDAPRIADGLRASFEADVDAEYRKTGLDGAFGQVCVVGWALNDDKPHALFHAEDEGWLLHNFSAELAQSIRPSDVQSTCVVGHNVSAFDLRFLTQRSIVRGIRPHQVIARSAQAKPWELDRVYDTMVQWGGLRPGGSLDKLCKALSIPSPKGGITGATVWDHVKAGRIAEVADYCIRDVEAVRAVHRRMTYRTPVTVEEFEDAPSF